MIKMQAYRSCHGSAGALACTHAPQCAPSARRQVRAPVVPSNSPPAPLSRIITLVHAALLMLLLTIAAGTAHASTGDDLVAGCKAMYRGAYEEALTNFRLAEASDNTCAEAVVGEAAALLQLGKPDEALERFERARLLEPEMAAAYAGQGAAQYVRGDCYQAMLSYRQALTSAQTRRARLRASEAYLACRLGLYQSARAAAEGAATEDPHDALARHALAASLIGLGLYGDAVKALSGNDDETDQPPVGLLVVPSALMCPGAKYADEHGLSDETRLALAPPQDAAGSGSVFAQRPSGALYISRPSGGSAVSGAIEVMVQDDGAGAIDHIALLLDNRFMAVSNVRPFRVLVDTRQVKDGLRELKAEGYTDTGRTIASAKILIKVENGARTLASQERDQRRLARGELINLLTLRPAPLANLQLLGRALLASGQSYEGVAAYEYAFAHDPALPGIRADLLLGYRSIGLPTLRAPREIHLPREPRSVALTFDDGPHPVMTPWILELLDRYHVRATFFLVGKQAAMYPDLVQEIASRGHELGSHSYSHSDLSKLEPSEIEQELIKSRAAIRQACGKTVTLFRPPGGNYDDKVRQAAAACGFTTVFWTDNIGNYPDKSGPAIAEAMAHKLRRGGIVLLHNGYDETQQALPALLPRLKRLGLRMDTVSAVTAGNG